MKKKINEFIIDDSTIKSGSELIWLWIVIETTGKENSFILYIQRKKHVYR